MANLAAAIRRVRRAQRQSSAAGTDVRHRAAYEAILEAAAAVGGEAVFDELVEWLVARTKADGTLPEPAAVRRRARQLCTARGIEVPRESPLRP